MRTVLFYLLLVCLSPWGSSSHGQTLPGTTGNTSTPASDSSGVLNRGSVSPDTFQNTSTQGEPLPASTPLPDNGVPPLSPGGNPGTNVAVPGAGGSGPAVPGLPNPAGKEVMQDIIDLKPLETFTYRPWSRYLAYALGALCLLIAGALLFYLYKKYRKKEVAAEETVPPGIAAMRLLERLETRMDVDGRVFYFELSAVLRGYIGGRFGVDAMEMTSEEFLHSLRSIELPEVLHSGVRKFVNTSDPVKFAGTDANREEMTENLVFVRRFIEETPEEQDVDGEEKASPAGGAAA